jgi:FkbM family methyltransferase
MLVGTSVGRVARVWRDKFGLVQTSKRHFEEVGSIANDNLCRHLMTHLVVNDGTFLDVGSHIGSVIADVLHHCPTAKVHAFEAMPDKVLNLKKRFRNATITHSAVGEADGEVSFFIDELETGYSSLGASSMPKDRKPKEIRVPLRRLDGMNLGNKVDAMKIDVEGAEEGVVRGARDLLRNQQPIIYFESGPGDLKELGYTKTGIWQLFNELDYTVHVPHRVAHADKGLTVEMFIDSHDYPRRTTNYIAIPVSRRDEYRQRVRALLKF